METIKNSHKDVLLLLLKNLAEAQTASSISKELDMSRWGIWKILRKLERDELIKIEPTGKGKTSTYIIKLNWNNILVERTLSLYLAQESIKYNRWVSNFSQLENNVDFLILFGSILHSPKQANDIDILSVASKKSKFAKNDNLIFKIQETLDKKIHYICLTPNELRKELKKSNKPYLESIKKGFILFGQEKFVKFIKDLKK